MHTIICVHDSIDNARNHLCAGFDDSTELCMRDPVNP